jgi:hypothetical protein
MANRLVTVWNNCWDMLGNLTGAGAKGTQALDMFAGVGIQYATIVELHAQRNINELRAEANKTPALPAPE